MKIFSPRSIIFVGASNSTGKWGGIVFRNLVVGGYEGTIYPVNSREDTILDYRVNINIGEYRSFRVNDSADKV